MASPDTELETQLMEAGIKLANPPASIDDLLSLLNQVEIFLSKVDQSPSEDMQNALSPSQNSLVSDQLFKHSDNDVKAAVASCISEITRITAPEAPYDDEQMKKVFQLIVSSFENLSDLSSRSFTKRTSILETVAKVRSCVVMLDLECDALITEMFQHFLKSIRDDHPENVFSSMETIMTLVLEESEDISLELLSLLLATMKKSGKEVLPIARKLGETVLKNCSAKVKPYLLQAVKCSSISLDDFNEVVASICKESGPEERNDVHTSTEHVADETNPDKVPDDPAQVEKRTDPETASTEKVDPAGDASPRSAVINGVAQTREEDSLAEIGTPKKQEPPLDESKSADAASNTEQDNLISEKVVDPKTNIVQTPKKQGRKATISIKVTGPSHGPKDNVDKKAKKPLDDKREGKDVPSSAQETDNVNETSDHSLPPKTGEGESTNITSPSSGMLPEKTPAAEKGVHAKERDNLNIEAAPSNEDNSTKLSEETRDSEAKAQKGSVEKESTSTSNEDKTPILSVSLKKASNAKKGVRSKKTWNLNKKAAPSTEDNSAKPSEETSDAEGKDKKGSGIKAPAGSSNLDESPTISENLDNKAIQAKKKDILNKEGAPSTEDNSAKPSEETSFAEGKAKKGSGKKVPASSSNVDKLQIVSKNNTKKGTQAKKKWNFNKKAAPSTEDNSAMPSEETEDWEGKTQKWPGKKSPAGASDENKSPIMSDTSTKDSGDSSDIEAKSLKQSANKGVDNEEESNAEEDKNSHSREEHGSERDDATASADEDDKEVLSSPKPAGKSAKKEQHPEETPKMNSKRKRSSVTDKKEYGDDLVGSKVKVWWPKDKMYYTGIVDAYDSVKKRHKVLYTDGDEEVLNLKRQTWELVTEDSEAEEQEEAGDEPADEPSPVSSSELPLKKKMKATSGSSTKARKMDISPQKVGGASSSKAKDTKSAGKSEADSKSEGKSKDRSKAAVKSKTDDTGRNKDQTPKTVKSSDVSAKSAARSKNSKSGKSKEEDSAPAKTSAKSKQGPSIAGKSKLETPQASSNTKGKATKDSGKSNTIASGKLKSSFSKVKKIDHSKENSADSSDEVVPVKGKSPGSSKAHATETKSGKKRPRSSKS